MAFATWIWKLFCAIESQRTANVCHKPVVAANKVWVDTLKIYDYSFTPINRILQDQVFSSRILLLTHGETLQRLHLRHCIQRKSSANMIKPLIILGCLLLIGMTAASPSRSKRDIECENAFETNYACVPCRTTCEHVNLRFCTYECRQALKCYCESGYLYESEGKCIKEESCPGFVASWFDFWSTGNHRNVQCNKLFPRLFLTQVTLDSAIKATIH